MRMQFDNQSTSALGRVFQNLATLPARARLMEQENEIKAMMNRSLMDSRASQIELNRAKAARENQALGLMARAAKLFPTDRDAANFYALQGGGKAYTPFSNVGNTGYSINEATGVQTLGNPDLARIFQVKTVSRGAGGSGGSGGSSGPRLNPSQIKVFYPTPLLDDQGEPVINNSTLQPVMTTDDKAMLQDMIQMQKQGYPSTLDGFIAFKGGMPSPTAKIFSGVSAVQQSNPMQGMVQRGNINLNNRPIVQNPDGTVSTVRSMSINVDGKEVLIPTVSDDGRIMSEQEAIDQFRRTGKNLGVFNSIDDANRYAQQLHEQQASMVAQQTAPMLHTAPIQQTYVPPEQTNRNAAIESIRRRRQSGELSREDAVIALKALGFQ